MGNCLFPTPPCGKEVKQKMLDMFFYIGTILGFIFFIIGQKLFSAWGFFIAVVLFITIGIGLVSTGWETYDNSPILIEDINSTATQINFQTTTYDANISGNASNQMVYVIGHFWIVLGLVFTFLAMKTAASNKAAQA